MSVNVSSAAQSGSVKPTSQSVIDGQELKGLIESSLTWLRTNQQLVNALNVYPVPDGDTGTNMVLTMQAAYNEIATSGEKNVGKMAHAIARGALMGARGNSGVILSQLWRGFARAMDNQDIMDASLLVRALGEGRNTAYKGVVRPVEGTILTVAKDLAAAAEKCLVQTSDMETILEAVVKEAGESVQRTPDLLPILKQAGVVDSGGKGLFFIFEGMLRHLKNMPLDVAPATVQPLSALNLENNMESIEPGQDYEVIIDFRPNRPFDLDHYYSDLSDIGTSIQVGEGEGIYRMHIHVPTEKKYQAIDYTMQIGTITKIAMENLQVQMQIEDQSSISKITFTTVQPGQIAVVAVSPGLGISRIFASLGVATIVEGGQTMNPSTADIIQHCDNLPTDKIIILPNNKNIILAAQIAANEMVKKVAVVPSKSIPQGLSAMLRLSPDGDFDKVVSEMNKALDDVVSGEVTIATRSVDINSVDVEKGEVISLLNGKLVCSSATVEEACLSLLEKADTQEKERITLFYGAGLTLQEVNPLVDKIRSLYPSHEVEVHEGGQPHYQFIVSLE
jgi:DAK2 domain fusion protein YloV